MKAARTLLTILLASSLAGCASADPQEDYAEVARWIEGRSGLKLPSPGQLALAPIASGTRGLSLDEAAQIALERNPTLRRDLLRIGLARADAAQAGRPPNPSLSISALFRGGDFYQLTGSLVQGITGLLSLPAEAAAAEERLGGVKLLAAHQALTLIGEVTGAFYEALGLDESLARARESAQLAERSAGLVARRFAAGQSDQRGLDEVRAQALRAQRDLLAIDLQRTLARLKLRGLLGLVQEGGPLRLVGSLPLPSALPPDEELVARALAERLDLRANAHELRAAEEALSSAEWGLIPHLELGGNSQTDDVGNYLGPSLNLTIPLWDQGRVHIARALVELAAARSERERLIQGISLEVLGAAARAREQGRIVALYREELLPLLEGSLARLERAYAGGRLEATDLAQGQGALLGERAAFRVALLAYSRALAELERALAGRLAPRGDR